MIDLKTQVEIRYDEFRKMLFLGITTGTESHSFVLLDDATEAEDELVKRIAECTKRRGTQFAAFETKPSPSSEADPKIITSRWVVLQEPNDKVQRAIVL